MAQGNKTPLDKQKEVIRLKLKNPQMTLHNIEKKTGVGYKTCHEIIHRTPKLIAKVQRQLDMTDHLDEIINDILVITRNNVKKYKEKVDPLETRELKDLSSIAKDTFERKQILLGKPTSINTVEVNLEGKSIKELDELRKQLLNK